MGMSLFLLIMLGISALGLAEDSALLVIFVIA
jgi:hypothetical protein